MDKTIEIVAELNKNNKNTVYRFYGIREKTARAIDDAIKNIFETATSYIAHSDAFGNECFEYRIKVVVLNPTLYIKTCNKIEHLLEAFF